MRRIVECHGSLICSLGEATERRFSLAQVRPRRLDYDVCHRGSWAWSLRRTLVRCSS